VLKAQLEYHHMSGSLE